MYPYKDTGKRIKEVRTDIPGYTQKKLAKDTGVSENYIAMLERGEKKLTEGMAYKIGKCCYVNPEYLLLRASKNGSPIDIAAEHEISIMWNGFLDYICKKAGYDIEEVKYQTGEVFDLEDMEEWRSRIVCRLKNDSCDVPISSKAVNSYFEDIADYAVYKLQQMIWKEGKNNG